MPGLTVGVAYCARLRGLEIERREFFRRNFFTAGPFVRARRGQRLPIYRRLRFVRHL
jgi:hypothetical protein